ncbi:DUF2867 domain-containing protein [Marinomonas transparens]|uniref:DUF2867 domain-containing protein n=1 Tax=Marinomonas transparens TaxID=2795388 RepID=A0A934JY48_9GAMM|nr:DUF2867 domain-containing protein [Marinomonas transparens]MBJ7539082.1 DUF2867 domain-containing protein [Marinomonas transparens]
MSKITEAELPSFSLLHDRIKGSDFVDCYAVESDLSPRQAADIVTNFPGWAQLLVRIRNAVVSKLGLLDDGPEANDKVGFFPVEAENDQELIAGFNDKHLDFRLSVISQNGQVFLSTWVHTHNIGGKIYLKVILPFHILIVRNALARVQALSLPTRT